MLTKKQGAESSSAAAAAAAAAPVAAAAAGAAPSPAESSSDAVPPPQPPQPPQPQKTAKRSLDVGTSTGTSAGAGASSRSTNASTSPATSHKRPAATRARARRRPLHVEAILHPHSTASPATLRDDIRKHVLSVGRRTMSYRSGPVDLSTASEVVRRSCHKVDVVDLEEEFGDEVGLVSVNVGGGGGGGTASTARAACSTIGTWLVSDVLVHVYVLSDEEASAEELDMGEDNDDEELTACETLVLPHASLHGSWDSLILPRGIKSNLLDYASTAMLFSDKAVSGHLVGWNSVILLHGPPGTGKTCLCRALAHKLAIRLSDRFVNGGVLLEVHSHSLFSKWFSESGKLVSRLFDRIREMVEDDPDALVCVLVDEVESLAAARSAATGGGGGGGGSAGEPSDAVRAVNSLLTSIDKLRQYRNVVVMTTSNLTGSVDLAFVDRADVKQFVGLPILEARYEILRSCVLELVRVGIVCVVEEESAESSDMDTVGSGSDDGEEEKKGDSDDTAKAGRAGVEMTSAEIAVQVAEAMLPPHGHIRRLQSSAVLSDAGSALLRCAELSEGMSGRSLRKLPFQSHALFVRTADPVPLGEFLVALVGGVEKEQESRRTMKEQNSDNHNEKQCNCPCTCGSKDRE